MSPWNLRGSPSILGSCFHWLYFFINAEFSSSPGRAFSTNGPRAPFFFVLGGTVPTYCLATYLGESNIRNWLVTSNLHWNVLRSNKIFGSSCLSQVRHWGCQLEPRAFITLPSMMKSEHLAQQDAKSTWKSCLQYFLPSNSKNVPSYKNYFPRHIKWYSYFFFSSPWMVENTVHTQSILYDIGYH